MRSPYLRRLAAAVLCTLGAASLARAQGSPAPSSSSFSVLVRATPVGSEQVTVEETPQGWIVSSSGRMGPPIDIVLRTFRAEYGPDWTPKAMTIDASIRGDDGTVRTTVTGTTARSIVTSNGAAPVERTDAIDAGSILFANPSAAAFEAIAARLRTAPEGTRLSIYQPPGAYYPAQVGPSTQEQIKTIERVINAKRTRIMFLPPNAPPLPIDIWADERGRLLRVNVPSQTLDYAREDIASVSTRLLTMSRPNDEDVHVPANGFLLAGTLSKPADASGPLPAVLLVAGSGTTDRDENVAGVALFGQLANSLADAGYLVLRYDKRGSGESGGRVEAATLTNYAEDARAAINFLWDRKDVDRKRIAIVGHSEGGWIGLLAAVKNSKVAKLALVSTVGSTGSALNLYQVDHRMEQSNPANRASTIELQKKVQQAVISGKGWDTPEISPAVRRQADTPYFQSFLLFDPAKVMKDLKQPLLIVQGERDAVVPPSTADTLASLASARKGSSPPQVVKVPGINHLLVPATTGEVDEYATLADRTVSPAVTKALVDWLGQPPVSK